MRRFLLFLSLMTGCEVSSEGSEVKGCTEGWAEFTCRYPQTTRTYQSIDVVTPKRTTIRSTEKDKWENKDRLFLYHDTINKELRVAIRQLEREDFGDYECKFHQKPKSSGESKKVKLEVVSDTNGCQRPFNQTAYRAAKTTITCGYSGKKPKFLCKDEGSICEDILSTKPPPKSAGRFTLTETSSGFNVSISNVASHDAGVYWCGEEDTSGRYRAALRKIQLEVDKISTFTLSPTIGQDVSYWCKYTSGASIKKFICKGEDPSACQRLVSTTQLSQTSGRFSMKDDRVKYNVTVTVRAVTSDDAGTYWCGAEISDETHSNTFFHRLLMTVASPPVSPTSPTSAVSSTQSSTASADTPGGSQVVITVIVCVSVLLVLILILIYKRFSRSKSTSNGAAAQHIKEDYVYEEIKERVPNPDSGNAMNTIYATANFPTNPSASLHYSTISFQKRADGAGGGAPILKPSSAACEYSTVKHSQSSADSTVNQP